MAKHSKMTIVAGENAIMIEDAFGEAHDRIVALEKRIAELEATVRAMSSRHDFEDTLAQERSERGLD